MKRLELKPGSRWKQKPHEAKCKGKALMQMRPSAMLLAYLFPPANGVGIHRPVALARYLTQKGWQVTVLTAKPDQRTPCDPHLLKTLPPDLRVIRAPSPDLPRLAARLLKRRRRAEVRSEEEQVTEPRQPGRPETPPSRLKRLVDWSSWWLHVPDSVSGWFVPALRAGLREMRQRRPDILFATGPPWTGLVVAAALSVLGRVPLVADFRDPWHGTPWHNLPYRAHRAFRGWLEAQVVRRARRVTCAWEGIERLLRRRYPLKAQAMGTVLNGFDLCKLDAVSASRGDSERCTLIHTGNFYIHRSPAPLFQGLRTLCHAHPEVRNQLLALLVGSDRYRGRHLSDLANAYGVADMVRIVGHRPHTVSLGMLKGADVALLFGQSGSAALASVPGKVYEYIGAGKPVLAIDAGEEACKVLRRGGCRVWPVPADAPDRLAEALWEILEEHRRDQLHSRGDNRLRSGFSQARMAERLELVLRKAMNPKR